MRRVREVIVVEGRYDKNALRQVVDATVVETRGFGIFNDRERLALLRRLAEERGLILLTDSDGAGFVIRNFLKGAIPKDRLKQAYIPDVYGKERRKAAPGREGKLGVEGMNPGVLLQALERAGATFEEERPAEARQGVTKADFYQLGLTGAPDSGARREALLRRLRLPERMSANALLEAVNVLYAREAFLALAEGAEEDGWAGEIPVEIHPPKNAASRRSEQCRPCARPGECQEESGQRGKYITLEDGTKVQDRRHGAVR